VTIPDLASPRWRRSTHSDSSGGNCVEVAALPAVVAVRDSKDPDGPRLLLRRSAFASLTLKIRAGQYDL
jgi:hypothetical protein